ncbi:Hypothetical protein SSA_2162 [Streptococcus sanguinis SK36]|uniref:Uncharacterized protein n=1 Tax=Streptococcus sanguinis (strain SK36) TaxID=388919 RepID=A3CQS5_STRSV|nr:Hypothetical protein SSA_2162 [Streptococcus sanguinis SK36]AVH83979.1 hypothetical protein A6J85_10975 [Streptococcus gordonii]RHE65397.1 hypothetical protein DW726_02765 [Streptococcus gordonii]
MTHYNIKDIKLLKIQISQPFQQKNRQLGGSYREIIMKKKSFRISKQS